MSKRQQFLEARKEAEEFVCPACKHKGMHCMLPNNYYCCEECLRVFTKAMIEKQTTIPDPNDEILQQLQATIGYSHFP
ncbi:MAG: hypothetical protein ACXACU_18290 [Candidatus Hodarchaeales archaeon]|jgi:ribosomal protein L37AE/L43A